MEASRARRPRATAAGRGEMREREPRGAAGGAAFNQSRRSTYEPSPDPQRPPETQKRAPPIAEIRARISELTAMHRAHHFKTIASTMARSLGASMARGLGILLIMMTLSEIAATRAWRRP